MSDDLWVRRYERRHHATHLCQEGSSPLATLARWMCNHGLPIERAPRPLLESALVNVGDRLSWVAAREPARRHRRHFDWLLGWYERILRELGRP